MDIEIRGERLLLDHRRALVWPRQKALFLADTHFGKSAVFRREGIALPEGSDAGDLAIISELLATHGIKALYILGDFVHGALPPSHGFYRTFNAWRAGHDIDVHVVAGNHDRYLLRELIPNVQWHDALRLPPFTLVHDPEDTDGGFFMAGHIHPVLRLSTRADSLRMPVFWQREDGLVLPSFGELTGGYAVTRRRPDRLFATGPDVVIEIGRN